MWKKSVTLEELNSLYGKYLAFHMGIEFTKISENTLEAKMPVDRRTMQPFELLHGGASCVLAETLGSVAAHLCIDDDSYVAVGVNLTANHLKSAATGWVTGKVSAIRLGNTISVWDIEIKDEKSHLICKVQFSTMITKRKDMESHPQ